VAEVSNWIINYNGLIVDFKDVTEGYFDYPNGDRIYFQKLGDNRWRTIFFPASEMSRPQTIANINNAHARAGTNKVTAYFMDLLEDMYYDLFSRIISDAEIKEVFKAQVKVLSEQTQYETMRYQYISEPGAILIGSDRYTEGQVVYFSNHRYVVKVDSDGYGYLDIGEYPTGKGFIVTPEQKFTQEVVRNIDYTESHVFNQGSGILFEYNNPQYESSSGTIVPGGGYAERRIMAPAFSDVVYYECVDFTPGSRDKVTSKGRPKTLEEGKLSSKSTPTPTPSQPSGNYGDWEVRVGGGTYGHERSGGSRWVKLRNMKNHRLFPSNSKDAIWYKATGTGFEEIIVPNFLDTKSSERKKVNKIYYRYRDYFSNAFIEELKKEFGYRFLTFKEYVNKYRGDKGLRAPKGWKDAPHNPPPSSGGSGGTKTKFFGEFNISSGSFKVQVRYNTFLRYTKNGDTISRGRAKLELIKYLDSGWTTIETLFNVDYNVGNYWNRNTDKFVTKEYKGTGRYGFKLTLIDTYQDTKTIYVRAQPTVTELTSSTTKEYDGDASCTFFITNAKTLSRVPYEGADAVVLKGKQDSFTKCFTVTIPKGEHWIMRYQVRKGNISSGGILGHGAAARLRRGYIKYNILIRIPPLVITTDIGRILDLPSIGWLDPSEEEQEGESGEKLNPFAWFDAIAIESFEGKAIPDDVYQRFLEEVTCYPKGVEVDMWLYSEEDWSDSKYERNRRSFEYYNERYMGFFDEDDIELVIKNPFDESIQVQVRLHVDDNSDECGGGGFISFSNVGWEFWGKGDLIGDGVEEIPSVIRVAITELISNHEIIGGCPGCYAEILVKDTNGRVLETIRVDEGGWVDFATGNLYNHDLNEFDIEIKTYQEGYVDPRGFDVRCMFVLDSFNMYTQYELSATNFDSKFEFYINDERKFSVDTVGEGEHYFPVKKGLNRYKFVFSTNNWDYNWDYIEIPWIRLTNWICDDVTVVPYCEPGGGDKCIEALIGCVLGLLPKKTGCVIVKHIDDETGEVMKQVRYDGYSKGEYTFYALDIPDFEVVGEDSKTVFVQEVDECAVVEFYYRKLYRDCVYVIYRDITTGRVISKKEYSNLAPGEYIFSAEDLKDYEIVGESSKSVVIEYLRYPPEVCKVILFDYRYIGDKNPYLDCVWVIHREKDNPDNVLATENYYNLEPGKYKFIAKDFEGYELVGDEEVEIVAEEITDPINECKIVIFEYRRIKKGCVIVKFKDRVSDIILDTDYYYDLYPGEYSFNAKEFEGYKLVDDEVKTILVTENDKECKEVVFLYEPLIEGCVLGKKIWLFT
jgi:hypothetical protein